MVATKSFPLTFHPLSKANISYKAGAPRSLGNSGTEVCSASLIPRERYVSPIKMSKQITPGEWHVHLARDSRTGRPCQFRKWANKTLYRMSCSDMMRDLNDALLAQ